MMLNISSTTYTNIKLTFNNNRREIWDTIFLIALQGFNYLAPLIVFPYLMIILGSEKFGFISFSLAIVQYLMLIVDFGFNLSATKRIARAKENQNELNRIFWATLLAKLCLLFISFIILFIFVFAIPRFHVYSSTILILFLMVIANVFSFVWFFQGLGKIRLITFISIISKFLILPLTFVFVKSPSDYLIAALIQSFVYILSSLITCCILINKKYISYWLLVSKQQVIKELKASYPIFLSIAATSIYTAMFVIILGYYSTPAEVGKYAAVEKIMRSFSYLIFLPISQSFYPKISALSQSSLKNAVKLVRKITIFIGVIMCFVFVIMFFLSSYLTDFLGKDYQGTKQLFKIMSFIPFFISMGGVFGQLGLLALGNERDKKNFQKVYFFAGGVALLTIFILVPKFLAYGASISLFLTELSVFVGMLMFSKNKIFV